MQKQLFPKLIPFLAIFGLLACQLDALMSASAPTATATRAATSTRALSPTAPAAISILPTPPPPPPAPTNTPEPIVATITTDNLRVRSSPSTSGAIVDKLNRGEKIQVVGRTPASDWLQIPLPSNANARGWISAQFAQLSGPIDLVPVIQPGAPTQRPYP